MPLPRSGLAGVRLNLSGETMPDGGFAYGDAGLLQDDQENAAPERERGSGTAVRGDGNR